MDKRQNPKTDRHLYKQSNFDYQMFGIKVKQGRILEFMTQQDLAEDIGCVRSTISKCERGMPIRPDIMISLCIKFKMNILDYCIYETV